MKKPQRWFFSLALLTTFVVISMTGTTYAKTVTFDSLLDEMVDRSKLANFPSPLYTCKQVSSYDRRSVAPGKPGWFANIDNSIFLRSELNRGRKELVIMDVKGPGAMVRWWLTHKNNKGTLRIYIDGATEPTVEGKIDDLFNEKAMVGAPLGKISCRGRNLFLPIPYAKSCKITYEGINYNETKNQKDRFFYQINYRDYPAGTKVESFTRSTITNSKAKIETVQKKLLNPGAIIPEILQKDTGLAASCQPGQSVNIAQFEGPGAICKISIKLKDAKNLAQTLRSTVINATFDGEQTIWCPLSDFFGCGVGLNPYKGWYRQVDKDGTMTCWWVMPYKESCELSVKNLSKETLIVKANVAVCPWEWTDRSMYFHTNWRQQRNIQTKGNGRKQRGQNNAIDWNYLTVQGKGVYVGDTLALYNNSKGWWGEGDEKIFVDGEKFPSHFGTGTEDYYGYAWGKQDFFESPFHAQPRSETVDGHKGNITNTRVRLLDDIPFTKSYQIDMEIWHWSRTKVDYAVATYWYGRPGAKGNYGPQPKEATAPVKDKSAK